MIRILPDLESLSRAGAEIFVRQARDAVALRGRFAVALSGGGTPRRLYELLAAPPFREDVPWSGTHVFWGDERCVPAGDPRSNALMARRALLDQVPLPPQQVHPMDCRDNPMQSATRYGDLLRNFFGGAAPVFDLILLGLGQDGHTASLFPQSELLKGPGAWTAPVYLQAPETNRVTLTPAVINQARMVVFLVAGDAKAAILKRVLTGTADPVQAPAQVVQLRSGNLVWLADKAAASRLQTSRDLSSKATEQ